MKATPVMRLNSKEAMPTGGCTRAYNESYGAMVKILLASFPFCE
jgi:hypothetical protein